MKPILACLLLSACAAIVPTTAARLATINPLTADPGAIELVVVLPEGLAISPGSAILELGAVRGDESLMGRFVLEDRPVTLADDVPAGGKTRRYALAEADAARLRGLQAKIAQWKHEGQARGKLALGIGGCALGDGPAPDAKGSVLIRMAAEGPFLPLIDNGSLADLLGKEVLAAIKPCQSAE